MTSATNWSELIGYLVLVKQRINELDPDNPLTCRLPRPGATVERLALVENHLGTALDPAYREFLLQADGWPEINLGLHLLGTEDLLGSDLGRVANEYLRIYLSEPLAGWTILGVQPIAVAADDRDLVVVRPPGVPGAGAVAWLDGGVVEDYPGFEEWFRTVIELHRQELARLNAAVAP
ncbi:hypothetical protein IN07_18425 [Modestobacter caceresii]|uniref:Knr4/Smi1-like domain-containing protein n=1 Tax=Modestobacter caceresii TaxID=1522368 RepID=A0A098Y6C2_9ACTN|nr:SMI1/KNR4 family protein [Modestobacter caceresii]KGH45246.1 hypothetical protein IN07_18425 [Modestobacter caceresii]